MEEKNKKIILLPSIALLVFLLGLGPLQSSFGATLTLTGLSAGPHEIAFRDISITDGFTPTISTNKLIYHLGETGTLTIIDHNANVDLNNIEQITATMGSQVITLDETEENSGEFKGPFTFSNDEIVYNPANPTESARALININLSSPGAVTISDVPMTNAGIGGIDGQVPITHGVNIASTAGITVNSITISYANSDLQATDPEFQKMYYQFDPIFSYTKVTEQFIPNSFDLETGDLIPGNEDAHDFAFDDDADGILKAVTTNQAIADFIPFTGTLGGGTYVLTVLEGSPGGGGGGLIRIGLVLNLLAGINFGGSGPDMSAPSLQYGTPTSTEDGFGGILVTDDNSNAFPLVINGKGYYLPAFSTFIEPVQVNTGQDVDLTLTFLESTGVEHVAIHFVNENNDEISDTDAVITYHKGDVTKVDPQGILSDDITFSKTKDGNKYSFNFGTSFDESGNRHLIVIAWDDLKNSGTAKVFNALSVSGNSIPDDNISHMIYLDLGAYFITADGIFAAGEKTDSVQTVIGYDYPDFVGRTERHDGIIYDQIANEKARASQVMADKFNLDTDTFVEDNEVKPYDTSRRASELNLSSVGHKIRDFTLSPEENGKLLKELFWQEHLKAQKLLDSLLVESKYHK